jgi:ATP-dependent DNA helicase RecQ
VDLINELNTKAFDVLRYTFGYSSYKYKQKEIIETVISGNHTLAIMPTGAGKSLCY